jgi:hypothetical protein
LMSAEPGTHVPGSPIPGLACTARRCGRSAPTARRHQPELHPSPHGLKDRRCIQRATAWSS